MSTNRELIEKWKPLLESESAPKIEDLHRMGTTARLLENQKKALSEQAGLLNENDAPVNVTANVQKYDPVLISLVRRAMPKLINFDIMGTQAMAAPTGLVFAMRPKYVKTNATTGLRELGDDAFYNEVDSAFTGQGVQTGSTPAVLNGTSPGDFTYGTAIETKDAEKLGSAQGGAFPEMGFEIEKIAVEAKSRALKAQYSIELAQDMKAIHGLDTEQELASILTSEIISEINREAIRTVYVAAKQGGVGLSTAGTFDLNADSNGRWAVEKYKGLMYQIEREANRIALETRRGKGNILICSADVASALSMAGMLDTGRGLKDGMTLDIDPAGNTYVGTLMGRYKVYVDPYHIGADFVVIGYKGSNAYDAGLFYCPYVPLQMFKVIDPETFQPKLGMKTRYGMVANPFAHGYEKTDHGKIEAGKNVYYRRLKVVNLTGRP